ncbi:phosphatidylserine decarboxylase [Actinomycetospora sp. C-140]
MVQADHSPTQAPGRHDGPPGGTVRHALALVRETLPPLHPGGAPVIGAVAAAALGLRALRGRGTLGGLAVTAGVAAFFRAPHRTTPRRAGIAVAPADGTVSLVDTAEPPEDLVARGLPPGPRPRVSVFLSVYDVHVQRVPVDGQVRAVEHRPGSYLSADLPAASDTNARTAMWVHGTEGHDLAVLQIAGLVARRIVCDAAPGDEVRAGDVYGLIRFGSRVDLLLPPGSTIHVEPGQRAVGGETVLADLPIPGETGTR